MNWYIYLLRCENNSLYTGITTDLKKRFNAHKIGKGAKYTKVFKPVKIEIAFMVLSKSSALKVEIHIKKKAVSKKTQLINFPEDFTREIKNILGIEIEKLTEDF
ncbi:MAG: GIY-YIG nuclease family protein [Fusobacteriaceae bacterium]